MSALKSRTQDLSSGTVAARLGRQVVEAARVMTELDGGSPDQRQQEILRAFPGWGAVAKMFDPQPVGAWAELADELDEICPEAITAAARIVDTSFFTPPTLVDQIWGVLRAAGFSGGSVLDLGCGAGAFLQHAPTDLPIAFTGMDADPFSAQVARALHPGATIIAGELQKISLPRNKFDAAVGNLPFSAAQVHDSASGFYGPLHEYFVHRAVRAVRPGGYVVVVTSRHAMDAARGLSSAITEHADLIAAVRLPSGYFAQSGTSVVADVLVLRVRDYAEQPREWSGAGEGGQSAISDVVDGRACSEWVSSFWTMHPELVAGEMRLTGFDRLPLAVRADDPAAAVAAAFATVRPLLVPYSAEDGLPADLMDIRLTDEQGRKEGSLHVVDGQVVCVVDSVVARPSAELRVLIELRDAAVALLEAEADWDRPDHAVEPLRVACREAYTGYVARFGALNLGTITEGKPDPETGLPRLGWRVPNLGGFRKDPDAPVVFALESFDQDTGQATPAPILHHRVNKRPEPATRAGSPGEALAISLGEGRVWIWAASPTYSDSLMPSRRSPRSVTWSTATPRPHGPLSPATIWPVTSGSSCAQPLRPPRGMPGLSGT